MVERLRGRALAVVALATSAILLLGLAANAPASDATLSAAVHTWSTRIAVDARAVSLDARMRHPRLMTAGAVRFRRDALPARLAISRQHASGARGRQAKGLALRAFSNYALAGRRWAASGRARVAGHRKIATSLARTGATYARRGNRLLVAAGKLLP